MPLLLSDALMRVIGLHTIVVNLLVALSLACSSQSADRETDLDEQLTITSPLLRIERRFVSMEGPIHKQRIEFPSREPRELLWITGVSASVIGPDGAPLPDYLLCHLNLDLANVEEYWTRRRWQKRPSRRLFTVAQGQPSLDLPDGFGIPVWSDERLDLTMQLLNPDGERIGSTAQISATIFYERDPASSQTHSALYMTSANALVGASPTHALTRKAPTRMSLSASGRSRPAHSNPRIFVDESGSEFTGHWLVPPGRHIYRSRVDDWMTLGADGTWLQRVGVHLHPFAESVILRDLTDRSVVYSGAAYTERERGVLHRIEERSARQGLRLEPLHEYELEVTYNNVSGDTITAMAALYLYVLDRGAVWYDDVPE